MSTSSAVWRGTLIDWVTDALGHARAQEAQGIVDNLTRGKLADLATLRYVDVGDLVHCGCPEDVARKVLAALDNAAAEDDYDEGGNDLCSPPHARCPTDVMGEGFEGESKSECPSQPHFSLRVRACVCACAWHCVCVHRLS